jgi:hypothetical protein
MKELVIRFLYLQAHQAHNGTHQLNCVIGYMIIYEWLESSDTLKNFKAQSSNNLLPSMNCTWFIQSITNSLNSSSIYDFGCRTILATYETLETNVETNGGGCGILLLHQIYNWYANDSPISFCRCNSPR